MPALLEKNRETRKKHLRVPGCRPQLDIFSRKRQSLLINISPADDNRVRDVGFVLFLGDSLIKAVGTRQPGHGKFGHV